MPQLEPVDYDPFAGPDADALFDARTYGPQNLTLQDLLRERGRGIVARDVAASLGATEGYAPSGPRTETRPDSERGAIEKLLGIGGERYQTWPERMVRSGFTLPSDVLTGREPIMDPATGHTSGSVIERTQDLSGLMAGGSIPAAERGAAGAMGGKLVPHPDNLPKELAPYERRTRLNISEFSNSKVDEVFEKLYNQGKDTEYIEVPPEKLRATQGKVEKGYDINGEPGESPYPRVTNDGPIGLMTPDGNVHLLDGHHRGDWAKRHNEPLGVNVYRVPGLASDDIAGTGLAAAAMGGRVKQPTVAEATAYARELVAATGARWESFTPEQQAEWLRRSYDQIVAKRQKDLVENPAPTFYSAVERAVADSKTKAAPADQWLNTLRNTPGVRKEELDWMGLDDWAKAQKGPVTKEALQAHLQEQATKLDEVWKQGQTLTDDHIGELADNAFNYWVEHPDPAALGASTVVEPYLGMFRVKDDRGHVLGVVGDKKAAIPIQEEFARAVENRDADALMDWSMEAAEQTIRGGGATRYGDYQLPGGENYREMLMTMPPKAREAPEAFAKRFYESVPGNEGWENLSQANRVEWSRLAAEQQAMGKGREDYSSSHWDEPNVLLHLRMNDRTIPVEPTPEHRAARDAYVAARASVDTLHKQVMDTAVQIREAAIPLEKARRARIEADMKSGKISRVEGIRRLDDYEPFPELQPLQDKLQRLRNEEDALRAVLPHNPGESQLNVLHMEELQSDWHQQGRKEGYKGNVDTAGWTAKLDTDTPGQTRFNVYDKNGQNIGVFGGPKEEQAIAKAAEMWGNRSVAVPDAPFKASWPELGLKRMIREAAEKGYDAITWTPGEQQAARYDLSKHVNHIDVKSASPGEAMLGTASDGSVLRGNKHVKIQGKSGVIGSGLIDNEGKILQGYDMLRDAVGKNLADVVGKDVAEKIIKAEGKETRLEGLDLRVGGEGMKAFYDKMLVDKANALAKKFGGKVEWTELPHPGPQTGYEAVKAADGWEAKALSGPGRVGPFKTEAEANAWINKEGGGGRKPGTKVPMLRITPAMRDAALGRGFPLYATGLPFAFEPVDHDPFKDEQK